MYSSSPTVPAYLMGTSGAANRRGLSSSLPAATTDHQQKQGPMMGAGASLSMASSAFGGASLSGALPPHLPRGGGGSGIGGSAEQSFGNGMTGHHAHHYLSQQPTASVRRRVKGVRDYLRAPPRGAPLHVILLLLAACLIVVGTVGALHRRMGSMNGAQGTGEGDADGVARGSRRRRNRFSPAETGARTAVVAADESMPVDLVPPLRLSPLKEAGASSPVASSPAYPTALADLPQYPSLSRSALGYITVPSLSDPAIVAAAIYDEMKGIHTTRGGGGAAGKGQGEGGAPSLLFPLAAVRGYLGDEHHHQQRQPLAIDIVYTFVDPKAPSFAEDVAARRRRQSAGGGSASGNGTRMQVGDRRDDGRNGSEDADELAFATLWAEVRRLVPRAFRGAASPKREGQQSTGEYDGGDQSARSVISQLREQLARLTRDGKGVVGSTTAPRPPIVGDPQRYRDWKELLYSLRSLYYNVIVPAEGVGGNVTVERGRRRSSIGKIYIVVSHADQAPPWLNLLLDDRRIVIVEHAAIFPSSSPLPSALPTFNSYAIEAHIHRIPGLARHYIYFNNDMLLARPVSFFDYFQPYVVTTTSAPTPRTPSSMSTANADGSAPVGGESSLPSPVVRWLPMLMPDTTRPSACAPSARGRRRSGVAADCYDLLTSYQLGLLRGLNAVAMQGEGIAPSSTAAPPLPATFMTYAHLPTMYDGYVVREMYGMEGSDGPSRAAFKGIPVLRQAIHTMLHGGDAPRSSSVDESYHHGAISTSAPPPSPPDGRRSRRGRDVFTAFIYGHYALAHRFGYVPSPATSVSPAALPVAGQRARRSYRLLGPDADVAGPAPGPPPLDAMVGAMGSGAEPFNLEVTAAAAMGGSPDGDITATFITARAPLWVFIEQVVAEAKRKQEAAAEEGRRRGRERGTWRGRRTTVAKEAGEALLVASPNTTMSAPRAVPSSSSSFEDSASLIYSREGLSVAMRVYHALHRVEELVRLASTTGKEGVGPGKGVGLGVEVPVAMLPAEIYRRHTALADGDISVQYLLQQFVEDLAQRRLRHLLNVGSSSSAPSLAALLRTRAADDDALSSLFGSVVSAASSVLFGGGDVDVTPAVLDGRVDALLRRLSPAGLLPPPPPPSASAPPQAELPPNVAAFRRRFEQSRQRSSSSGSGGVGSLEMMDVWRSTETHGSFNHWLVDYFTMTSQNIYPQTTSERYYFVMMTASDKQVAVLEEDLVPRLERSRVLFLTVNDDVGVDEQRRAAREGGLGSRLLAQKREAIVVRERSRRRGGGGRRKGGGGGIVVVEAAGDYVKIETEGGASEEADGELTTAALSPASDESKVVQIYRLLPIANRSSSSSPPPTAPLSLPLSLQSPPQQHHHPHNDGDGAGDDDDGAAFVPVRVLRRIIAMDATGNATREGAAEGWLSRSFAAFIANSTEAPPPPSSPIHLAASSDGASVASTDGFRNARAVLMLLARLSLLGVAKEEDAVHSTGGPTESPRSSFVDAAGGGHGANASAAGEPSRAAVGSRLLLVGDAMSNARRIMGLLRRFSPHDAAPWERGEVPSLAAGRA